MWQAAVKKWCGRFSMQFVWRTTRKCQCSFSRRKSLTRSTSQEDGKLYQRYCDARFNNW
ncbi:hypothetical protein DPMN_160583 [Dreissena polymorpha]|uniref:Uncharacterized protein n=1 Tax=Dreissena polymorpha TaxID=45954 RepID=A0A9D4EL23_DREPO|nr:hypothetical protein DPMN_160583 [Dreissena polymorpha]